MTRDMNKTLMRILSIALLMMVSIGAWAQVTVIYGDKGDEGKPYYKFSGGTIEATKQSTDASGQVTVTITVTPNQGYTITRKGLTVVAVYPTTSQSGTRAPEIASPLELSGPTSTISYPNSADYQFTVPSGLNAWVQSADFQVAKRDDGAKGDSGYSGTYYIRNMQNTNAYWYLVPCMGGGYYNDNEGTPYLTTYQTNQDMNSLWRLEKETIDGTDYYRIIHNATGLYVTFNEAVLDYSSTTSNAARLRLHLEAFESPTDVTLFYIKPHTSNGNIAIRPKDGHDTVNNYYWWDIGSGNQGNYWNNDYQGALGLWWALNAAEKDVCKWNLITATATCATPVITYDESAGSISLSYPIAGDGGVTIYYTTDGSEPTSGSSTYSTAFSATGVTMVRAIAVKTGYGNSAEAVLYGPLCPYLFKTTDEANVSYYMIPPTDDDRTTDLYVTTSNVPNERMQWYLKPAALRTGVQYYYFVNAVTGKYAYCNANENGRNALLMKDLGETGTESDRYMFRFIDYGTYLNIVPKHVARLIPSSGNKNCLRKANATDHTNPIGLYQDDGGLSRWTAIALPDDPKSLFPQPSDMVSSSTNSVYFKLRGATQTNSTDYFLTPPTTVQGAATAAVDGDNQEWCLLPAGDDDTWCTYYYLRNGSTGRYLYFDGTIYKTDGTTYNDNSNKFFASNEVVTDNEDKYKFLVLKTANTTYSGTYHIVPKSIRNNNNQASIALNRNNSSLRTQNSRVNNNSCWYLTTTTFTCEAPAIKYDEVQGKVTMTCPTRGAKIYYVRYTDNTGADPNLTDATIKETLTLYDGTPVSMVGYTYIKAIAARSYDDGSDQSSVTTYSPIDVFKCVKPVISYDSEHSQVTITSATEDAKIYYVVGDENINTSGEGSPNGVSFSVDAESTIKAVAMLPNTPTSQSDVAIVTVISSWQSNYTLDGYYILANNFSSSEPIGTETNPFTGTIDGGYHAITLSHPLIGYAENATIKNVILDNFNISSGTTADNVGAVCCEATGSTRIYNCGVNGGEIGGTTNVGGIVGKLEGTSRVVNCYSYADIKSGTNRAGIVGNNTQTSTQASLTTMVMNCMFYGDIATGGTISPIYGGMEINNVEGGMNNYNYYRYRSSYSVNKQITKYNRALPMEEKFINRFERYRLLLNSNKNLAAKYVDITPDELAKWVLETADRSIANPKPYPVLKKQNIYPSIINYDAKNAPDSAAVGRLNGGKLGKTLAVTIRKKSQKTTGGRSWPTASGSDVLTTSLTLIRTDKDTVRYNFNYDKVQLPYYNDIGTGNYTENRVVTGWKIIDITDGTAGSYSEADEWGGYNFADRNCTKKDLYSESKRVFSQGAYFDVPKGVTAITIEPYWAIANYVSDDTYDVVYNNSYTKQTFSLFGTQYTNDTTIDIYNDGSTDQKVYTSISGALAGFDNSSKTVYDQAVVLVGNVHQYAPPTSNDIPYTLMSIDMNHDNEPDYSYIFSHDNRRPISPIRYDFLNIMGIAEAQIPKGATTLRNVSIFNLTGWFEITNTCVVNFSQFEYDNSNNGVINAAAKSLAPLILLGGTFEQFVSTQKANNLKDIHTKYIHVGSNAWFAKFGNGTHSDGSSFTPHIPISVTGGDYDEFYLSGTYQPNITDMQSDNAECYISGGRFGEMAGASLEAINGDVRWDINWADITNFYGGGVNGVNPITGDIRVDMTNSYVNQYCGGPKFGDMVTGKTVTTNATDCVFATYFGAGYGGNTYNRVKYLDEGNKDPVSQQGQYTGDRGKYYDGVTSNANDSYIGYGKKGKGVATDFDYEFFIWSTGVTGSRFFVKFATFSLATTHNVISNLTKCKVTGNVYGGGSLGKVAGDVSTTLNNCEINGNVFGAGYSATLPKISVRNTPAFVAGKEPKKNMNIGMFEPGEINTAVEYEWKHVDAMPSNGESGIETTDGKNYVYTEEDLSHTNLGSVSGAVTLTITGNSKIGTDGDTTTGNVYGGGDQSTVNNTTTPAAASTTVTISGNTEVLGNVYGGGNQGLVSGSATVKIQE